MTAVQPPLLQCAQNIFDTNMSELICIIGRISTSIGDKQQSKVADLAKYVHLPEVGTFQVSLGNCRVSSVEVRRSRSRF